LPNSRRAVLRSILAGAAVATVPAVAASATALSSADLSAISTEKELVAFEQMAAMNFEPWSRAEGESVHPSDDDVLSVLPCVRLAWLLMHKTKTELEDSVIRMDETDEGELFEGIIRDFASARKNFQNFADLLGAAECRVMSAACAVHVCGRWPSARGRDA
jgi:hypothetical protein